MTSRGDAPTVLTPRFSDALECARAHHAADLRKGTTIPYVAHLLAVSALVLENGGDETAAVAALLHDVVEDHGGQRALSEIRERFGGDVAGIVEGCSDTTALVKEDWEVRKTRYLEHLGTAPAAVLLVSAADKLHNARSILADLREHGDELWARFNRGVPDQLWCYSALRDLFSRRFPGAPRRRARPHRSCHQPPGRSRRPDRRAGPLLRAVEHRRTRGHRRHRRLARVPARRHKGCGRNGHPRRGRQRVRRRLRAR